MTLSTRLSLFVALIVIGVVASVAYLEIQAFERDLDHDLMDAARLGAQSAADNVAARTPPFDPIDLRDSLHDLIDADPLLDAISVIQIDETGRLREFAGTSTEERAETLELAGRALASGGSLDLRTAGAAIVARPVPRQPTYAVAVTVGLETLLQAHTHGLSVAMGFGIPTVVFVIVLVHFTTRSLVGRPLRAIVQTMEETGKGVLSARAPVIRRDELGTVAAGLNSMLDQLGAFNRTLVARVDAATQDLSARNAELAASQAQLLATRESLARAERVAALGQVAATVAHQAGTPLNLVSGYVQMIRDDPATDERTRSRLATVDTQIQQVTRVLRSMLDRARQPSTLESVSLETIVDRVREVAQPRLSQATIQLDVSIAPGLPRINADATQLEMAILNLVTNALDAMKAGGVLSIRALATADGVRVEVADTGPGIPAELLRRLFEPWVTTKPAGQGTGLGLAIVRDVVQAHGGTVTAANTTTGALFTVDLPASVVAVEA